MSRQNIAECPPPKPSELSSRVVFNPGAFSFAFLSHLFLPISPPVIAMIWGVDQLRKMQLWGCDPVVIGTYFVTTCAFVGAVLVFVGGDLYFFPESVFVLVLHTARTIVIATKYSIWRPYFRRVVNECPPHQSKELRRLEHVADWITLGELDLCIELEDAAFRSKISDPKCNLQVMVGSGNMAQSWRESRSADGRFPAPFLSQVRAKMTPSARRGLLESNQAIRLRIQDIVHDVWLRTSHFAQSSPFYTSPRTHLSIRIVISAFIAAMPWLGRYLSYTPLLGDSPLTAAGVIILLIPHLLFQINFTTVFCTASVLEGLRRYIVMSSIVSILERPHQLPADLNRLFVRDSETDGSFGEDCIVEEDEDEDEDEDVDEDVEGSEEDKVEVVTVGVESSSRAYDDGGGDLGSVGSGSSSATSASSSSSAITKRVMPSPRLPETMSWRYVTSPTARFDPQYLSSFAGEVKYPFFVDLSRPGNIDAMRSLIAWTREVGRLYQIRSQVNFVMQIFLVLIGALSIILAAISSFHFPLPIVLGIAAVNLLFGMMLIVALAFGARVNRLYNRAVRLIERQAADLAVAGKIDDMHRVQAFARESLAAIEDDTDSNHESFGGVVVTVTFVRAVAATWAALILFFFQRIMSLSEISSPI